MNETAPPLNVVGEGFARTDAVPKTTGTATYTVAVSYTHLTLPTKA